MAPLLTFVAAMATLGAVSAAHLPSVATTKAGEHSLRGGRQLQTLLCNSIGCPAGYTPIADAMNTECDGDTCEVSQCCEAFCSYHACPDGYIPTTDAATTMCDDSGCTTDLCCVNNVVSTPTTSTTQDDDTATTTTTTTDDDGTFTESPTGSPSGPSPIVTTSTSETISDDDGDDDYSTRDDDC